jgi:hypothetical protein
VYTNWNFDEPRMDKGELFKCVAMNTATGKWFVQKCDEKLGFACRDTTKDVMPPAPINEDVDMPGYCPTTQAGLWVPYGSYCYYVNVNVAFSFNRHIDHCISLGGDTRIASIPTKGTNEAVASKIKALQQQSTAKYYDTWIGYLQTGGTLEALDGTPVNYVNWENGNVPDSSTGTGEPLCVFINGQDGYWLLKSCTSPLGVVCRKLKGMYI